MIEIMVDACEQQGVEFIPYDWLKSDLRSFDIFHVHWPDAVLMGKSSTRALLKLALFWKTLLIVRMRNIPILWTVHNVKSNNGYHPLVEKVFWRLFLPCVSAFHHLAAWSAKAIDPGERPSMIVPHPHYRGILGARQCQADARHILRLPQAQLIFLAFGQVQPYKGYDNLIEQFKQYGNSDALMIIVGRAKDKQFADFIRNAAQGDPRIRLDLRFVETAELQLYIEASDLVVMAYRKINNSGAALLALSVGRPILAPDRGAVPDLLEALGDRWVCMYEGGLDHADLAAGGRLRHQPGEALPDLSLLDPEVVGTKLRAIYTSLLSR